MAEAGWVRVAARADVAENTAKAVRVGDKEIALYHLPGGEFRFRLHEGEQKLSMSIKGYKTKDEVLKIIDTIKKEAPKAKVDDQTAKK